MLNFDSLTKIKPLHPIFLTVIGAIFILSVVIVKLLLYGRDKFYLNFLLSLAIAGIAWYGLIYLLTNSGLIKDYPYLFNKGLPFYYTIAPCLFLYFRGSLNKEYAVFRPSHLLHFLIAIPAVISIIPYNMLSYAAQHEVVSRVVADVEFAFSDSEYIVEPWHWYVFPISALIYTILQIRLAYRASKQQKQNKQTIKWIYFFSAVCFVIFAGMLVINVSILQNRSNIWSILHEGSVVIFLCFCLLVLSFMFFLNPELIYGFTKKAVADSQNIQTDALPLAEEKAKPKMVDTNLAEQVAHAIKEKELFRRPGLNLSELASALEIQNHKLSELFNNHYKLNFSTYINNLRIEYIKTRLDQGDWKQLTLEAIALDAGFSSRNTFFNAFKKVMHTTPSVYLSALKDDKKPQNVTV
ncbi:AraC family transcriptional regulator [Pedobacter sp. HDW13]|uniref:helix-turn-helix domain-containing protein n=1 Tax=unclassified Pedobacter TaxID=2628915 RepID=UPI00131A3370|nr:MULTISPECIES: helix-turn-helix domain-containing protein [unclassified Pedobacter]QIL38246.1 AraC family transcriptional regulator [Pedobacter sp. HDW13]